MIKHIQVILTNSGPSMHYHYQVSVGRTDGTQMRKRSRAVLTSDTLMEPDTSTKLRRSSTPVPRSRTDAFLPIRILLLLNLISIQFTQSFTLDFHKVNTLYRGIPGRPTKYVDLCLTRTLQFSVTAGTPDASSNTNEDSSAIPGSYNDAQRYKDEAAKMRLEAERMDLELAIVKMETLQNSIQKFTKKLQQQQNDGARNNTKSNQIRESIEQLEEQILALQKKIGTERGNIDSITEATTLGSRNGASMATASTTTGTFVASATTLGKSDVPLVVSMDQDAIVLASSGNIISKSTLDGGTTASATSTITRPSRVSAVPKATTALPRKSMSELTTELTKYPNANYDSKDDVYTATIYGFDKSDLDLYLPVALEIEAAMSNATAEERLEKFRTSPVLQTNFRTKLTQMFVEPIQEMNRLQELKQEYLDSSSSKEKEMLKRQIDTITKALDTDGPFVYSDSVYRPITEMSAAQMNERLAAMQTLPDLLQTIYKQRYNLDSTANLTLAILLDHYEVQLQLLEQIKMLPKPFNSEIRSQIVEAIESLPIMVRNHAAIVVGLKLDDCSIDDFIAAFSKDDDGDDDDDDEWWSQIMDPSSIKSNPSLSKASQLTGMDWSALGDISTLDDEGNDIEMIDRSRYVYDFYPAIARMEQELISYGAVEQISKTVFDSKKSFMVTNKLERVVGGYYIRGRNLLDDDQSGVKLMEHVQRTLLSANVTFDEEFEYFYLRDPAPLTDEEIELEYRNDPVFAITSKNNTRFYDNATPLTKAMVTLAAFASMGLFAMDYYHLDFTRFDLSTGVASIMNPNDVDDVMSNAFRVVLPLTMLQLVHETGHRIIAWRDKFRIGIPTFVPSIQLGCIGTITPLKSPPPSFKSMFDFGMSGPLLGLLGSFVLLADGLQLTSMMDINHLASQPSIPTYLLRASTLGSAFIEWFLGSGSLIPDVASSSLPLHPFAIAGYIGMISNALALLPLGNTDGGRIAVSMFGRRGILLVRTLVAAILCGAGLVGLDDSGILLNYVIVVMLWQNEIETPARNEVEELDFGRGCFGIGMAALVLMILLPLQS